MGALNARDWHVFLGCEPVADDCRVIYKPQLHLKMVGFSSDTWINCVPGVDTGIDEKPQLGYKPTVIKDKNHCR